MFDFKPHPWAAFRETLFCFGLALVGGFVLLVVKLGDDWRWVFGFPVLFALAYLWLKLWAWAGDIDRDGLTPEERAERDWENGNWR